MTRNDPHALRPLPPTDSASASSATPVVASDASDAERPADASAADADDARVSLAMRVLAWLPLRLWTDCGVCLFWRGAVVGAVAAGAAIAILQAVP